MEGLIGSDITEGDVFEMPHRPHVNADENSGLGVGSVFTPINAPSNLFAEVKIEEASSDEDEDMDDEEEEETIPPPRKRTGVCGIRTPSKGNPTPRYTKKSTNSEFKCPRCGTRFSRAHTVKQHFPGCVEKWGNPDGLCWWVALPLGKPHKAGNEPKHSSYHIVPFDESHMASTSHIPQSGDIDMAGTNTSVTNTLLKLDHRINDLVVEQEQLRTEMQTIFRRQRHIYHASQQTAGMDENMTEEDTKYLSEFEYFTQSAMASMKKVQELAADLADTLNPHVVHETGFRGRHDGPSSASATPQYNTPWTYGPGGDTQYDTEYLETGPETPRLPEAEERDDRTPGPSATPQATTPWTYGPGGDTQYCAPGTPRPLVAQERDDQLMTDEAHGSTSYPPPPSNMSLPTTLCGSGIDPCSVHLGFSGNTPYYTDN